ncbi:MAG: RNA-binding domain-containing protein [Candidatus Hadarchaeota archaeon]|nr:RNA-binding domain-containing protein [Candidatus Hadarchaeota archaeon]
MSLLKLRIEAPVKPTESQAKIEECIKKIFPTLKLKLTGNLIVGESRRPEALGRLHQKLRLQAIRDSARKILRSRQEGNRLRFMLNKQAATISKVSFTDGESPLGPITVTVKSSDLEKVIDYLAPKTREGKPVKEVKLEEIKPN